MQEIKDLVERLSCNELWFVDDNFLVPARRVRDLFKLMDQENLTLKRFDFSCRSDCVVHDPSLIELAAKHGAKIIYLGVEAGVQRHLDLYHKGTTVSQNRDAIRIIKEAEADIKMEFIFFNPWITFEEIKETIAFLEDVKVYDPYILTSILSLTRHTPLGEDVEAGRRKIIQTSPNDLQDFDFEAFIPYKISDERARMVFYIVSQVLVQFEPALYAVYRLFNLLRKDRKRLPEDLARHYEGLIHDFQQLINETSLDIFKETITWVENLGKPESVESFRYDLTCKTLRFAEFLANQAIQPQEKEFIRAINESGTASF